MLNTLPQHWLEDCPEGDKLPAGYVCKICGGADVSYVHSPDSVYRLNRHFPASDQRLSRQGKEAA